jgi:hypothetical protein
LKVSHSDRAPYYTESMELQRDGVSRQARGPYWPPTNPRARNQLRRLWQFWIGLQRANYAAGG